jgi:DNA polymerase-3 subunit gamma/tau
MAASLSVPALTRAWQILTKGAEEMRHATHTSATLEMILVRLGYASALPTPAELVRRVGSSDDRMIGSSVQTPSPLGQPTGNIHAQLATTNAPRTDHRIIGSSDHQSTASAALKIEPQPEIELHSFTEVVTLFEQKREAVLASHLVNDMRLVSFANGRIEVKPISHMNADVPARISRRLGEWTGNRWSMVYNEAATGEPTLRELRNAAAKQARDFAAQHPKVQATLKVFPDAQLIDFIPSKSS